MSSSDVPKTGSQMPADPHRGNGAGKNHRWMWILVAVLVVGGVAAYQIHWRSESASKDSNSSQIVSVSVAPVEKRDMPYYL